MCHSHRSMCVCMCGFVCVSQSSKCWQAHLSRLSSRSQHLSPECLHNKKEGDNNCLFEQVRSSCHEVLEMICLISAEISKHIKLWESPGMLAAQRFEWRTKDRMDCPTCREVMNNMTTMCQFYISVIVQMKKFYVFMLTALQVLALIFLDLSSSVRARLQVKVW